jgi:Calcineurin-like phosphoesterase
MRRIMPVALFAVCVAAHAAYAQELRPDETVGATRAAGTVFWDGNTNGTRDPGEEGVAGVRVKAGWAMAATDEDGRYEVTSEAPFVVVSMSFPSGMRPTGAWFHRMVKKDETGIDFGLKRVTQNLPFLVAQFTDVHRNWASMQRVHDECAALPQPPVFYICTGDMRSGSPWISNPADLRRSFGQADRSARKFGAPLFMTPGNHDTVGYGRRNLTPEDARHPLFANRCWERYVGPSSWSFTWGGVHFMGVPCYTWEGGRLTRSGPAVGKWIRGEVAALPEGTRTVLAGHASGAMAWVPKIGLSAGVMGDTHTVGRFYNPGSEQPSMPPNVYVTGVCQAARPGEGRPANQDGRPAGYRLLNIAEDGITSFYKPFREAHAILVNEPRRFVTVRAEDNLVVRGQIWDPKGQVSVVRVSIAGQAAGAVLSRGAAWQNFEARLPLDGVASGFHDLDVRADWPEGAWHVTEPYLLLTGRQAPLDAPQDAVVRGVARGLKQELQLTVNGRLVATISPVKDGEQVAVTVPAEALRALNEVRLTGPSGATLDAVRMDFAGRSHVDQHRVFRWGYQPRLNSDPRAGPLYFDLRTPGTAVQWQMQRAGE